MTATRYVIIMTNKNEIYELGSSIWAFGFILWLFSLIIAVLDHNYFFLGLSYGGLIIEAIGLYIELSFREVK